MESKCDKQLDNEENAGNRISRSKEKLSGTKQNRLVHFEDILDVLGHFGPFQIRVFSILTLMDLATGQAMMLFIFANQTPPWSCLAFMDNSSLPNDTNKMCESVNQSKCIQFHYDITDALRSMITEYDLVCQYAYLPQLNVSIQMVGTLLGALFTGYVADWVGRKKTLLTMSSLMMGTLIMTGFSQSWIMFTIIRFISGFFLAGTIGVCFTLPMEFIGPKWRTFCGSLALFGLGIATMSLAAYLTRDWRHVSFIAGAITLPLIPAIFFWVPESVRWLAMKGRFEEADTIIIWMARFNKTEVPDLNLLRRIAAQDKEEQKGVRHSYVDLFRTKALALQTFVIMYCWYSCSSVAYGVSTMYSTFKGTVFLNSVLSTLVSTPFAWSVIYVGNRFGRRRSFMGYMAVPCVSMVIVLIIGFLGKKDELGTLVTILVLVAKGSMISCWTLAAIYSAELYPTVIRNLGVGAANMSARLGAIIAPQLAYVGEISHWIVPYVIYTFLCISTAVLVVALLPETNKLPLTDGTHENQNIVETGILLNGKDERDNDEDCGICDDHIYVEDNGDNANEDTSFVAPTLIHA